MPGVRASPTHRRPAILADSSGGAVVLRRASVRMRADTVRCRRFFSFRRRQAAGSVAIAMYQLQQDRRRGPGSDLDFLVLATSGYMTSTIVAKSRKSRSDPYQAYQATIESS